MSNQKFGNRDNNNINQAIKVWLALGGVLVIVSGYYVLTNENFSMLIFNVIMGVPLGIFWLYKFRKLYKIYLDKKKDLR